MENRRGRSRMKRGQWQVERERLHVAERAPASEFREAESMAEAIPKLMAKLGLEESHWVGVLSEEWVSIVGETVGCHTRPGRIDGRHLIVFVDSSTWLGELARYGRKEMLSNLQNRFGLERIRSLSLKIDPDVQ